MPLSGWWCALGWCAATALFVGIVALLGGPSLIDTRQSVYATWGIAHGQLACAYPPVSIPNEPPPAPLYLLLSGGIAAITRIGHSVAFPSAATLGHDCNKAFLAMNQWSIHAGAVGPTTWIGCVGWLALMVGVIAWLRASGRGRCGWEPATLVLIACLLPVWMCVQNTFHPQDLLAIGLALCAMACACTGRWIGAGILVALAVLSQQFALLVAAPLLLLAPANRRISYTGAALTTGAIVVFPLLAASGGHALRAITLGTGDNPFTGGTVLWELHLYGIPAVLVYRLTPIVVSVVLSWWVSRRLGAAALQAATLMSLVAVSLGLRLVFEVNLYGYYFMALAVSLVLLDVARGYVRSSTVAWLAAVALVFCLGRAAFNPVLWGTLGAGDLGTYVPNLVPLFIVAPALLAILLRVLRGGRSPNALAWLAVAGCALLTWPSQIDPLSHTLATWFWQVAIVVPGIMLAAGPLLADIRLGETKPLLRSVQTVAMVE